MNRVCCNGNCNQGRNCPITRSDTMPITSIRKQATDAIIYCLPLIEKARRMHDPVAQEFDAMFKEISEARDDDKVLDEISQRLVDFCERVKEKYDAVHAVDPIVPPQCAHDWPEADGQTDIDGACTKCGMSFQRYIHMECP